MGNRRCHALWRSCAGGKFTAEGEWQAEESGHGLGVNAGAQGELGGEQEGEL